MPSMRSSTALSVVCTLLFAIFGLQMGGVAVADAVPHGPSVLPEPPSLAWDRIDLHFAATKKRDLTVTFMRDQELRVTLLRAILGSRSYEIAGAELSFLGNPLIYGVSATIEDYPGEEPTVSLIVPYSERGSTDGSVKLAFIVVLNMRQHRIQHS